MKINPNIHTRSIAGLPVNEAVAYLTRPNDRPEPVLKSDFRAWKVENLISLLDAVTEGLIQVAPEESAAMGIASSASLGMAVRPLAAKPLPRIMVVDDDMYNFDLLQDTFEDDYEVMYAVDGMSALEIAAKTTPDLILLDVMMPDMDGYEVCKRLKSSRQTCDIPVIFITSLGDSKAETLGLELGAMDYITKPINSAAVRARVNNQLKLKWALDHLTQVIELEQSLRSDLLEVLEIKSRNQLVH